MTRIETTLNEMRSSLGRGWPVVLLALGACSPLSEEGNSITRGDQAFAEGAKALKEGTQVESARASNRLYEEAIVLLREAAIR